MKIGRAISDRVVVVGTSPEGRGGISSVIASHRGMSEAWHFIKIHDGGLKKVVLPFAGLFRALGYAGGRTRVAHVHTASFKDFYRSSVFVLLFKALGKRVVLHVHGAKFEEFYGDGNRWVDFVCRRADALVTVSSHFVDFLRRKRLNENVVLIPNSVRDRELPVERDYGEKGRLRLSYMGALDDRKGIFDVVEALGRHREELGGSVTLTLGGNGDVGRLEGLVERYGLGDVVDFRGWLDSGAKERLLTEESDCFVHPSVFESFGISILEALDHGLPVVTTSVGGIKDLVRDGYDGLIVEAGNVEEIYKAIVRLRDDVELRRRLGTAASEHARGFADSAVAGMLEKLYRSLIERP